MYNLSNSAIKDLIYRLLSLIDFRAALPESLTCQLQTNIGEKSNFTDQEIVHLENFFLKNNIRYEIFFDTITYQGKWIRLLKFTTYSESGAFGLALLAAARRAGFIIINPEQFGYEFVAALQREATLGLNLAPTEVSISPPINLEAIRGVLEKLYSSVKKQPIGLCNMLASLLQVKKPWQEWLPECFNHNELYDLAVFLNKYSIEYNIVLQFNSQKLMVFQYEKKHLHRKIILAALKEGINVEGLGNSTFIDQKFISPSVSKKCSGCYQEPVELVGKAIPCNHVVYCSECTHLITQSKNMFLTCPLCKKIINLVIRDMIRSIKKPKHDRHIQFSSDNSERFFEPDGPV